MGPARAFRELPGSTPQTSPRRAGRKSDLTNDSFNLKASAIPGITRSPSQASSGRPSGGTGKVFTFVEGLISVKDDRAPASENHVCMGFFFFSSKHSSSQEVRYSARQNHALLQAGMLLRANQVPGATLSVWILVPSHSGFSELGKHDTCLRHLFMGSNCILQAPHWMSTLGTVHLPLRELSTAPGADAGGLPIHA